MSKLEEAKEILSSLKVPAKQQNGMCCCVLLAMANLVEEQSWISATNNWIRIHDVIAFANSNYETTYAENSRETFRKQAMHHFRNAAFIEDNGKATNSPNYRYRLTDEMLHLIQSFGTADWERSLARFMENHDSLVDLYASKRTMRKMPVKINAKTSHFRRASTTNCKRLLSRNLRLVSRLIPSACTLGTPQRKIWLRTWASSALWALK